jgi:hypothetical protein
MLATPVTAQNDDVVIMLRLPWMYECTELSIGQIVSCELNSSCQQARKVASSEVRAYRSIHVVRLSTWDWSQSGGACGGWGAMVAWKCILWARCFPHCAYIIWAAGPLIKDALHNNGFGTCQVHHWLSRFMYRGQRQVLNNSKISRDHYSEAVPGMWIVPSKHLKTSRRIKAILHYDAQRDFLLAHSSSSSLPTSRCKGVLWLFYRPWASVCQSCSA